MKRSTLLTIVAFTMALSTASSAKACLPYIPWLDPFAWLGFYGCGGCYGGGHPGMGYGYGAYQPPVYSGYAPRIQQPIMNYPVAPTPGCNCTGALPQPQQAMTAVQVPVTTYRPVTQYVPQTTYRTQYQRQAVAYAPPSYAPQAYGATAPMSYPATAFAAPTYAAPSYVGTPMASPAPSTVYQPTPQVVAPPVYQPPAVYESAPNVARPYPAGDIMGDHEYPTQSLVVPNPSPTGLSVRPVSYGVTPRPARSFSAAVR